MELNSRSPVENLNRSSKTYIMAEILPLILYSHFTCTDHTTPHHMDLTISDASIYIAARNGDLLDSFNLTQCDRFRTPSGDHVLHLAARSGHNTVIGSALNYANNGPHPLLFQKNARGETPMHLAAQHGHLAVVRLIAERYADHAEDLAAAESGDVDNLRPWRIQCRESGDTPLHKALRNGHEEVALYLLGLDKEATRFVNHCEESPLYLAAESQCDLAMEVIMALKVDRYSDSGPLGRNPLHAAVRTSRVAVTCLSKKRPDLITKGDHHKRTPLHYAAEEGHKKIVKILLKFNPDTACLHDKDGFTPLHRAAMAGSYSLLKAILKYSPHSIEFLDIKEGKTVLHLAKLKSHFLRKGLRKTALSTLLNHPDHKGNTPLHSAIMELDESKTLVLLSTKGINWRCRNQNKLSPLDMCQTADEEVSKKLRIVSLALKTHQKAWLHRGARKHRAVKRIDMLRERFRKYKEGDLRHMINNMALVATLIVTLAYAVAFSVPGGYDSSDGKILLRKKITFQVFHFSIMVALLVSIAIIINYPLGTFFAKVDTLSKIAHDMAIQLHICLALTVVAFIFGVYSVTSHNTIWIAVLGTFATLWCVGMPLFKNWIWVFKNRVLLKRVGYVARLGLDR